MATLAFLGLGAMGGPMAARLIDAGHEVTVWNRTQGRAEALPGAARVAGSPADAAQGAEAVITMLATPDAVEEVVLGRDGVVEGIEPGSALIDMSTIGPDRAAELRERAPDGLEVLDVPVLGGVADAREGTLTLYFGATEDAFARWSPVLAPLGTALHLGSPGAGAAMKLVANSTLAGLMALVGEALALADGFGLDEETALAALLDSPIGPALRRKLGKIESGDFPASFRLALMHKDLALVDAAASRRDVELRTIAGAARWVEDADEHGRGEDDYSAVIAEIRAQRRS